MKEGPISLLKHRLTGKPIKNNNKNTTHTHTHRYTHELSKFPGKSVAMTLLQLWMCRCVMEQKVQYCVNTFQAISAYFMLVFTFLLFPAEGALGLG